MVAYSPDRKGIHPQSHLVGFSGVLQADAYAGFNELYRNGQITEAACWAHARRKIHDVHGPLPVRAVGAEVLLQQILTFAFRRCQLLLLFAAPGIELDSYRLSWRAAAATPIRSASFSASLRNSGVYYLRGFLLVDTDFIM